MVSFQPPESETARVEALRRYGVLDSPPEEEFDDLTLLASQVFHVPIALVGFIDKSRIWFKSRIGWDVPEAPREGDFFDQVVLERGLLVVPDALADGRFADIQLVASSPRIRFFAGAPLLSPDGHAVGAICVMDRRPHEPTAGARRALAALAREAVARLERRRERSGGGGEGTFLGGKDLRSELEHIPVIIWCTDLSLRITSALGGGLAALDLRSDDLVGKRVSDSVPADAPVARAHQRALEGEGLTVEQDWGGKTYEAHLEPFRRPGGDIIGCIGVAVDITARRRAELALAASEARYRTLAQTTTVGIWQTAPSGETLFMNPGMCALLEVDSPAELAGKTYREFYTPEGVETVLREHQKRLQGLSSTYEVELLGRRGGRRSVVICGGPVHDPDGTVESYIATLTDITEMKRQRRELAALYAVMSAMSAVSRSLELTEILSTLKVLLAEELGVPGGRILFCDEPAQRLEVAGSWGLAGTALAEPHAVPLAGFHAESVVRALQPHLESDLRALGPPLSELETARPDWGRYLAVPLAAQERVQGVLELFIRAPGVSDPHRASLFVTLGSQVAVAIHNARLYHQLRSSRERLAALSRQLLEVQEMERRHLARELHDEIGQALTAVRINLESWRRRPPPEAVSGSLDESIGIVDGAIEEVRKLSTQLRPSVLDDLGLEAALRWYLDRQAQRAGWQATLTVQRLEERLPHHLETVCFRVAQEALTNAARHARARSVKVELRPQDGGVDLLIADDGVGFDPEEARRRALGGQSLGLLGMEERVRLAGGRLEIFSRPGGGTEVLARFPIRPPSRGAASDPAGGTI